MKKNTELQISQTQKKCNKTEELLLEEIEVSAATLGATQVGGRRALAPATASADRGGARRRSSSPLSLSPATLAVEVKNENGMKTCVFASRDSDGL